MRILVLWWSRFAGRIAVLNWRAVELGGMPLSHWVEHQPTVDLRAQELFLSRICRRAINLSIRSAILRAAACWNHAADSR